MTIVDAVRFSIQKVISASKSRCGANQLKVP
jgi:hypothetical protein